MIIPPLGPLEPNDPYYGAQFPVFNTPQPIMADEHDGVIQLRKQDNKLSIELDLEQLELVKQVLTWVKMTGLQTAEAEQAIDILAAKQLEVEGR